jgi:hypothetical protein
VTDSQPPASAKPTPEPPLSPKPGNLAIAILLVVLLFANLYFDSRAGDYDGKYLTFAVAGLIAGVLGVDLTRFWRGDK